MRPKHIQGKPERRLKLQSRKTDNIYFNYKEHPSLPRCLMVWKETQKCSK